MFICTNPKFVYVSFTKSGSRTMYGVLRENFRSYKMEKRTWKKIPPQYHNHLSFCVVRNPYSRMVSWWWSICKSEGDRYGHKKELRKKGLTYNLVDFLTLWKDKRGTNQSRGVDENNGIDYIIKLENLEHDFNNLPFIKQHIPIPKTGKRDHPHWKELIDQESGKLINDIYYKDFEYFGYEIINFDD